MATSQKSCLISTKSLNLKLYERFCMCRNYPFFPPGEQVCNFYLIHQDTTTGDGQIISHLDWNTMDSEGGTTGIKL